MDVSLSCRRQAGPNCGFPVERNTRRSGGQTFFREAIKNNGGAPNHHTGSLRGFTSGDRRTARRGNDATVCSSSFQQVSNNGIEQDHGRVKQRIRPMLGFERFEAAAVTISGIELAARIRKHQFKIGKLPGRQKVYRQFGQPSSPRKAPQR
jgi:transposase-like protein